MKNISLKFAVARQIIKIQEKRITSMEMVYYFCSDLTHCSFYKNKFHTKYLKNNKMEDYQIVQKVIYGNLTVSSYFY